MSFTKGEWWAEAIEDMDNCEILSPEMPICHISIYGSIEERSANAHLISQAPKMYEALKTICNLANLPKFQRLGINEWFKDAEIILAKAEGKC